MDNAPEGENLYYVESKPDLGLGPLKNWPWIGDGRDRIIYRLGLWKKWTQA